MLCVAECSLGNFVSFNRYVESTRSQPEKSQTTEKSHKNFVSRPQMGDDFSFHWVGADN